MEFQYVDVANHYQNQRDYLSVFFNQFNISDKGYRYENINKKQLKL